MPQMTGIELIEQVRKINPLISILVLSAYDNFEYVRSAMRHGAENYLLKPLDPDKLRESISNIVGHIQERGELSGTYGCNVLTIPAITSRLSSSSSAMTSMDFPFFNFLFINSSNFSCCPSCLPSCIPSCIPSCLPAA